MDREYFKEAKRALQPRRNREKPTIPDAWMTVLRKNGLSDEQIQDFLTQTDEMCRQDQAHNAARDKALKAAQALKKYGVEITQDEIDAFTRSYESYLRGEQDWTQDE